MKHPLNRNGWIVVNKNYYNGVISYNVQSGFLGLGMLMLPRNMVLTVVFNQI